MMEAFVTSDPRTVLGAGDTKIIRTESVLEESTGTINSSARNLRMMRSVLRHTELCARVRMCVCCVHALTCMLWDWRVRLNCYHY